MNEKRDAKRVVTDSGTAHAASCLAVIIAVMLASAGGQAKDSASAYPHAKEPIATARQVYDGTMYPDVAVNTFRNIDRLFPTRTIKHGKTVHPLPKADKPLGYVRISPTRDIYDFLSMNRVTGLLVLKNGKVAMELYQNGNTDQTRWMSMSIAKSFTSTLIGAAVKDGLIASINDPVTKYVPRLAGTGYEGSSIRDVLMMSSGVKWDETYTDPKSDRRALLEVQLAQKAGGALDVMARLPRIAESGTLNNYSTGETQIAAEILLGAIKKPMADYLSEKIWSTYGMEADANWWLDSPNGHEIGGSGISATLRDYGRFGQFFMDGGIANGARVLPDGWVEEASTPKTLKGGNTINYGYMWWTAPKGAFLAVGIFGQNIYINPTEKVVIVVWSAQSKPSGASVVNAREFYDAVVTALR
jgi:CubicO group peptidase (beta-lactamase class C family)